MKLNELIQQTSTVKIAFLLDGVKNKFNTLKLRTFPSDAEVILINHNPAEIELTIKSERKIKTWIEDVELFQSEFAIILPSSFKVSKNLKQVTQGNIINILLSSK